MKTYGKVEYNKKKNRFDITCEPHVAIRLKRVFSKIDTWQFGTQSVSATPENCLDLQWFIERYLLTLSPEAEDQMRSKADIYREKTALVDQLLSGKVDPPPFTLKLPPRPYQALAAQLWLANNGLLLADDVGLGKTMSSIVGLTDPRTLPALVVTLSHLPRQWEEEIHKFSDLTTHILKKGTPYDLLKHTGGKLPDVFICNYHKLAGWAETLAPIVKSLVVDECHELRHRDSQKYKAAKHISENVEYRIGASATPIFNYGGEIYNVLDILSPGTLGTWAEFEREWCTHQFQKPKIKDPAAFGAYAADTGLMLRRTRKDVKRELPEVTVVPHYINVDFKVLEAMKGQAVELAKLILKQGQQDFKGQKMQAAGQFDLKMRQATGIGKAPYVAEFIRMLVESSGEPIVVGLWHREVYNILMQELKDLNPVMFSGTETAVQKEVSKQKFIRGESKIMLLSLRSGAGMDGLQDICHIVVFAELDWAWSALKQFIGRVHRDGQDDPVTAYYLLSEHGSDPIMSDILGIKRSQLEGIINPNQDLVEELQEVEDEYVKKMAQRFLLDHGIELPEEDSNDKIRSEETGSVGLRAGICYPAGDSGASTPPNSTADSGDN